MQIPELSPADCERLGVRWYEADDEPIALLRAEARLRNPWIAGELQARFGPRCRVLDVGCGGGFLCNELAERGFVVTGLDAAARKLAIARQHDRTRSVRYHLGDALRLPYDDASFDAVCAMSLLEHVGDPARAIAEAARVLPTGGLFFFHTFNRNLLAWLVVVKGVEWCVRNAPARVHTLAQFIRPTELRAMCSDAGLSMSELRGMQPRFDAAFWRLITTGLVDERFAFRFTSTMPLGYAGFAVKLPL